MKFKHKTTPNAIVRLGYRPVRFVGGFLETTDKDLVKILKRSPNVEQVKANK